MNRQEKRKQLRDIEKELAQTKNIKGFTEIITNDYFGGFPEDQMVMLKDGKHPDRKLQLKYEMGMAYMRTIVTLETKRELLLKGE